ncbi:MAG: AI-2E family transporter [Butyrivibrio sp.]|nr:AI-2E family transporter [Butyrivibrio sp.]
MKFKGKWAKKKWVSYTIATCSAVVLYIILSNIGSIAEGFGSIYTFVKPVVTGMIIAYVFNPVANLFDRKVFKKIKNEGTRWKLSVAVTLILIILAVTLLFVALIPQLISSISTFISNVGGYVETLQKALRGLENTSAKGLFGFDLGKIANIGDTILAKISSYFSENMKDVVNTSANFGKGVFDIAISFILAIYLLLDKTRLLKAVKRLLSLLMKPENYRATGEFIKRCNNIIIRYISFDIIDGIIVGIVNFIVMAIIGIPYSVLISVIAGVTNLAPTFGPIVGAAIGAFILILVQPWFCVAFLIITIVLQTVDGYILKPKLFGESLGVSPLMILIAIILGGRLFGVAGILLAIPFAAILDFVYRDFVLKKLEEKHNSRYNI